MTSASFLEDFSDTQSLKSGNLHPAGSPQDQSDNSASFDEGYKCGWQDGAASVETDEGKQREALSEALLELKFTYFEARQHVLKTVRPVLDAMVEVALPEVMASSLGAQLAELLEGMASKLDDTVVISCAPVNETMLREAAENVVDFPISIVTEKTLTENQVVLHFEQGQSRIDLDETLAAIRSSVSAFYETPTKELAKNA